MSEFRDYGNDEHKITLRETINEMGSGLKHAFRRTNIDDVCDSYMKATTFIILLPYVVPSFLNGNIQTPIPESYRAPLNTPTKIGRVAGYVSSAAVYFAEFVGYIAITEQNWQNFWRAAAVPIATNLASLVSVMYLNAKERLNAQNAEPENLGKSEQVKI